MGMSSTATPRSQVDEPSPTPTPFPSVGRAALARFAPTSISIPRLGVDTRIVSLGTTEEGRLEAPPDYESVGWYHLGPVPGEVGRAILAGHLDSRTGPAVFFRLGELAAGDEIIIRPGGAAPELIFTVSETTLYWTEEVPPDVVYGSADQPELILITCGGPFDRDSRNYLQRQIVRAELRTG